MDKEKNPHGKVNSSGFPLQIGLAHKINETSEAHGWHVLFEEHSWINEETEDSGFIDLVIENRFRTEVMILECKRVKNTEWTFLVPQEDPGKRTVFKPFINYKDGSDFWYRDWHQANTEPVSLISSYCIVDGQDSRDKPLLERIASNLICSTEAYAAEEFSLRKDNDGLRIFTSVIVTTANLRACLFDPKYVSINDGTIHKAEYKEVPFIRFRKQLTNSTIERSDIPGSDYHAAAGVKEKIILVVNSKSFIDFLCYWEVKNNSIDSLIMKVKNIRDLRGGGGFFEEI